MLLGFCNSATLLQGQTDILGHVLAVDADPAVAAEAGVAVLAAHPPPPVARGRLHQHPPLGRQRRVVAGPPGAPRTGVLAAGLRLGRGDQRVILSAGGGGISVRIQFTSHIIGD